MHLSPQSQVVMLLTVSFGKADTDRAKPLTSNEWARFVNWLEDHELEPAALLGTDLNSLLKGWIDSVVPVARLRALLERGAALGLALEKWERAGIWVMTGSDPDYPERLKRHLRTDSPAVLFGCGNKALMNLGGITVAGSRDASQDDIEFARMLGEAAATQGYSIVSGAARRVEQSAMQGALDVEGTAVGILADGLIKSATSSRYRKHIVSGDLVLVSPFNPEAGFDVGNAISRNRYTYCLADTAIVVSSKVDKGGTWNGALENLRHDWVPLWVRQNPAPGSGNPELVRRGGHWMPNDLIPLSRLIHASDTTAAPAKGDGVPQTPDVQGKGIRKQPEDRPSERGESPDESANDPVFPLAELPQPSHVEFYTLFLDQVARLTSALPLATEDIAARLELQRSQVNVWLKRAVSERKIIRLTRPVRYKIAESDDLQSSLFGEEDRT